MANAVFSPKDFKAWVIEEATTGTAPTLNACYQLELLVLRTSSKIMTIEL